MKFLTKLSLFFFAGAVIVLAASAVILAYHGREVKGVSLELLFPSEAYAGAPFSLEALVSNTSDQPVHDAELSFVLPSDLEIAGEKAEGRVVVIQIGTVPSGSFQKEAVQVVPLFGAGAERSLKARLRYAWGRGSGFEEEAAAEFRVEKPALEVAALQRSELVANAPFTVDVWYKNTSKTDIPGASLAFDYPRGFAFVSASVPPDSLNSFWKLGPLAAGEEGRISIQGTLDKAPSGAFRFPFKAYTTFEGADYLALQDATSAFDVTKPPLAIEVLVNGEDAHAARLGERLEYAVRLMNTGTVPLKDMRVRARVSGELVDFSGPFVLPAAQGNFEWTPQTISALAALAPGATAEISFMVKLKREFPISRLGNRDYTVQLHVEAEARGDATFGAGGTVRAEGEEAVKIAGQTVVESALFARDPEGEIGTQGALPPRAGEPTQYLVRWRVKNFATDVSHVKVQATLPDEVRWAEAARSTAGISPRYDEALREATWEIETVGALRGVLNEPYEAWFLVELTPAPGTNGAEALVLSETTLEATDAFTGLSLTDTALMLFANGVRD